MRFSILLVFAFVFLPLLANVANFMFLRGRIHWLLMFLMTCVGGYAIWVGAAVVAGAELQFQLDSFDLDGDGSLSGSEMTAEAEEAMDAWASDTGRALAPIVGAPVSFIWNVVNYVVIGVVVGIVRLVLRYNARRADAVEITRSTDEEGNNPYTPPNAKQTHSASPDETS